MLQSSQIQENTPLSEIIHPKIKESGVKLLLKRDDLIHPDISGNKWRKLKYNLSEAKAQGYHTLLTFGGAFSNHIAATAVAAEIFGFKAVGIIRGEARSAENATLAMARQRGMLLEFVTREQYVQKGEEETLNRINEKFGSVYVIPEGGANVLGQKGCSELMHELPVGIDFMVTAIGTGTTFVGLLRQNERLQKVIGIPVLKGFNAFEAQIEKDLGNFGGEIFHDYHFGGYARYKPALIAFINEFKQVTGIALDPIYTGKMMYAVFDLIDLGYFPKGTTVVALHTGGLQGIVGFNQRYGELIL